MELLLIASFTPRLIETGIELRGRNACFHLHPKFNYTLSEELVQLMRETS